MLCHRSMGRVILDGGVMGYHSWWNGDGMVQYLLLDGVVGLISMGLL